MSSTSMPFIPFYIGDYIKDTRGLELDEKGAWCECLWIMWNEDSCGFIFDSWENISLMIGAKGAANAQQVVSKIAAKKVCDLEIVSKDSDINKEIVRIVNRRMYRAFQLKIKRRKSGSMGGVITALKKKGIVANTDQAYGYGNTNSINNKTKKIPKVLPESKNVVPLHPFKSEKLNLLWGQWIIARKASRKPLTELAANLQINLLNSFPDHAEEMLTKSLTNNYQGIFAPAGVQKKKIEVKISEKSYNTEYNG